MTKRSNFFLGKDFKDIMTLFFQTPVSDQIKSFKKMIRVEREILSFLVTFDLKGNNTQPFIQATIDIVLDDDEWSKFISNLNWGKITNHTKDDPNLIESEDGNTVIVRSFDGTAQPGSEYISQLYQMNKVLINFKEKQFPLTVTISEFRTQSLDRHIVQNSMDMAEQTNIILVKTILKRMVNMSNTLNQMKIIHGDIQPKSISLGDKLESPHKLLLIPPKIFNFEKSLDLQDTSAYLSDDLINDEEDQYADYVFVRQEMFDSKYRSPLQVNCVSLLDPEHQKIIKYISVSYTHLTLPTICSV